MDEVVESLQVTECQWCSQYLKWDKVLLVSSYKIHAQNSLKGKLGIKSRGLIYRSL